MAQAQLLSTRLRGLYLHANDLGRDVPDGALRVADNIVIDREDLGESRRGLPLYGDAPAGTGVAPRRLFAYAGSLFRHQNNQLYRDNGSGASIFERAITPPASAGRIRTLVADDGNLYLTSSEGLLKTDGIGRPWRLGGVPRPLDGTGTLTGGSGFLADQRNTAYRATLHYTDLKDKEIVSAPSQRMIVSNTAGGTRDVIVTFYLPTGLTTENFYRVFRSSDSASASAAPSDELQLVKEAQLTSADLAAGFVTFTDRTPNTLRGAALYTNPSREGIQNANERPPLAADIFEFEGHTFYVNVRGRQRYATQLVGVGAGSLTQVTQNGDISNGSAVVQNLASTANLHVGMKAKHASIPTTARILSIDSGTQVTLTQAATATSAATSIEFQDLVTVAGRTYFAAIATVDANQEFQVFTGGTPSANLEDTARALVRVVNRDTGNTLVYAFYTSNFEDIPGGLLFEERGIGGSAFGVSSTSPASFHSPLPAAQGLDLSEATVEPGGVYVSKFGLPEAVPLGTLRRARDSNLKRGLALRDSAILLGDKVHRVVGSGLADFAPKVLDETTRLRGADTAVVLNDRVYAHTSQGVVAITDGGVAVVSRDIERELKARSSDLFPNFDDLAHAASYETDRTYSLWIQDVPADAAPTFCWRYNAFTNTWTRWPVPATCALVNPANDRLYLGDLASGRLRRERKSFAREDFADDEYALTIASSSGMTVTVSSTASIAAGDLLVQGAAESEIAEVVNATTLRVADTILWMAGAATAYKPIECVLEWVAITGGNFALFKVFSEFLLLLKSADFEDCSVELLTDLAPLFTAVTVQALDKGGGWGDFPWGDVSWGDAVRGEQVLRTELPEAVRQAHWLRVALRFRRVFSSFAVAGLSVSHAPAATRFHAGRAA